MSSDETRTRSGWWITAQKWLIWGGLIGVVLLLHDLFPVIFFTFILAYIWNSVLNWMTARFPALEASRRGILSAFYILFIAALIGIGSLIIPRLFIETRDLARSFISQEEQVPSETTASQDDAAVITTPADPAVTRLEHDDALRHTIIHRETRRYFDKFILQTLGRDSLDTFRESGAYEAVVSRIEGSITAIIPQVIAGVREFVNGFLTLAFQFFLSILFSFLILWDLRRLRHGMMQLSSGRTAEIYEEIAPSLASFGLVLGRAFEAQTVIAIVNASLTTIAFFILGLPSIALLGTIVFFCSYVPVIGVVLSTLPAALLALKAGGFVKILWLVVAVLIVHATEAYALNPLIYGRHMKIHPVAVLIILLIGEELFGIWGLVLGVPIFVFFLRYVIRGEGPAELTNPPDPMVEVSAAEIGEHDLVAPEKVASDDQ